MPIDQVPSLNSIQISQIQIPNIKRGNEYIKSKTKLPTKTICKHQEKRNQMECIKNRIPINIIVSVL